MGLLMKYFNKLEEWLGGVLFLVIFVVLIAQILARQVFNDPLIWSEELARLLFVYVGMLGISMGIRTQQHVFIDFLTNMMSEKMRKVAVSFTQLLIFISLILFIHFGIKLYNGATFEIVSLGISEKWLYAALPLLSVLMLIRFLQAQVENNSNNLSYFPAAFFLISAILLIS